MKLRLKQVRIKKGRKQYDIAKKAKISKSYLSELERDKHPLSVDLLEDIAFALQECPKDLIDCDKCRCKDLSFCRKNEKK